MIPVGHRTFYAAVAAQAVASVALFTGHIDGTQWITVIPTILAIYGAKSVGQTYVQGKEG